jgi:2-polyprenyl-6-methoxyphenol hydroxylase-like FAD-dependent oxidoreductase
MTFDAQVLVAGAGPTGLMLAGDLAQAGVATTVLERRAGTSNLTRAFSVHARTLEQLDARGVADELIATGQRVSDLRVLRTISVSLGGLPSRFPFLLVTPQYETERVLARRAAALGATIRAGCEVTGLAQDAGGVDVRVREGGKTASLRAAYLVGTDGMHSAVREAIGMPFPGSALVRSLMLADVRCAQPPPEVLNLNAVGDALAFIVPFGDGWYRVMAWNRHDQQPDSAPVDLADIRAATMTAFGTDFGMHDPRWMSRFHSEERQVPRYRDGRVLLAGDAAHVHSPAGGQGMNTSIQDAANLGWKLAATVAGWAPDGLLDSYSAERHPVGAEVLRSSGALLRLGLVRNPAVRAARHSLARAVIGTPPAARQIAAMVSGIGIRYPAPRGAHPLTGRRVADLRLDGGGRLYEALRGGRFVLAAGAGGAVPADVIDGLADRVDAVTVAGPARAAVLIRPDAYIAWATAEPPGAHRDALARAALAHWCLPGAAAEPVRTQGNTGPLRMKTR